MNVRHRAIAAAAVAGLAAVSIAPAGPASAAGAPPLTTVRLSAQAMKVSDTLRQPTGPVRIRLTAVDGQRALLVVRIKRGHTFAELLDVASEDIEPDLADHERKERLADIADFRGGIEVAKGRSATMTVTLAPGTYHLLDSTDFPNGTDRYVKLVVTSRKGRSVAARPKATITMAANHTFTGARTLPRAGTIAVRNAATRAGELYLPLFYRVRPGTTTAQVRKAFLGTSSTNPFLRGRFATDALSPGRSELLTYAMPAGTYAVLCPMPGADDVPHGFKTMIRIVRLE